MHYFVYLFLDFDGVLHHFFPLPDESDERNKKFAFLPDFEATIRSLPIPVKIVISSSWRVERSLEELRSFFSPDIAALIVGKSPVVQGSNAPGGRLRETLAWLDANDLKDAPWVGIDDIPELYFPSEDTDASAAVVACMDKFDGVEGVKLLEAVQDPRAYAEKYPCVSSLGQKRVIRLSN